jgi:hypothetical protein
MRFKRVYLLSIVVLLLCASLSLGKKPANPGKPEKPQPPPTNTVYAGFDCTDEEQAVCTTITGDLDEFERTELYIFAASYQSTGEIYLQSNLGEPFEPFVRNDPDNICGVLGQSFDEEVSENRFTFSGNTNTYEASVGWKFFDLVIGSVTLPKVSFFYRYEAFVGCDQEDDPFVGCETTIENDAVLARVEGYVPVGKKRGKTIQCFWLIDDPDDEVENPVVFTVDGR